MKCAVVAVSILVHLVSPPFSLHPPTPPHILTSLNSLLTHCTCAATSAACAVAALKHDRKLPLTPGATPGASGGAVKETEGEKKSAPLSQSVPDLFSVISYCQTPSSISTVTARTLAHDVTILTVSPPHTHVTHVYICGVCMYVYSTLFYCQCFSVGINVE